MKLTVGGDLLFFSGGSLEESSVSEWLSVSFSDFTSGFALFLLLLLLLESLVAVAFLAAAVFFFGGARFTAFLGLSS